MQGIIFFGDIAEHAMWKYLTWIHKTARTALLHNYNVKMFHLFTGQCHTDQEFDFIVIFAEYKKFVHIEVKAGEYGAKGSNGSRKERTFTMKF